MKLIATAKMSIISKLDEMQKSALSNLSDIQGIFVLKMKSVVDEAEHICKLVHKHTQQMEFCLHMDQIIKFLFFLQKRKMVLADENQDIKDFIAKLQEPILSYRETPIFSSNQEFGSIELVLHPCSVVYKEIEHHEARLLFDIGKTPKLFSLHREIVVFLYVEITGVNRIVFIDQNKIAVFSYERRQLYIYDIGGKRLKKVHLDAPCKP